MKGERSTMKGERSTMKGERSTMKGERSTMKGERGIMRKTRLNSVASLLAAGVLMSGCMADVGGQSESEGGAAQGPNVVGGEAVGEAEQALTCGVLYGGQALFANQSNTSCDGRYLLITQGTDGNVVLYGPTGALWATYAYGAGNWLTMQTDGNLVVYTSSNVPVWSSGTDGNPGAWLAIQNDGNLVIYTSSNQPLWTRAAGVTTNLTNGSFETGPASAPLPPGNTSISGWTVGGAGIDYISTHWPASQGSRNLDLNGLNAGSIQTTLSTFPGATYNILFDMAGNTGGSPVLKTMRVTANGGSPRDYSFDIKGKSFSNMGWSTHVYSFVASSSSTVLTFTSTTSGPYGPALDNVR